MSVDYHIYSTKTGECISNNRYAGMPFLWNETINIGHQCLVEWIDDTFLGKIKQWTMIEKVESCDLQPTFSEDLIFYYSKSDIYELRDIMDTNKDVLVELMENNDSDGLIVVMI